MKKIRIIFYILLLICYCKVKNVNSFSISPNKYIIGKTIGGCHSQLNIHWKKINQFHKSKLLLYHSKEIIQNESNRIIDQIETSKNILQPYFPFPLDIWQIEAGNEIIHGKNSIVCAPTGAGKTVVGEMALHLAFTEGKDAIYTTPLKALSNQKFMELRKIFGPSNVGLSTGDMSINRGARITVMTTEVYRNMAWRAANNNMNEANDSISNERDAKALTSDLSSTSMVVLDEFHYMGQPGRGGVWEECVITTPSHTQLVGLSATLPNGERLSRWMQSVTGRETSLIEAGGKRPVPLRYFYASRDGVHPLFADPDAGPGSPKGLLGLRGDGDNEQDKQDDLSSKNKRQKKKERKEKFPIGLQLNPILLSNKEKQIQNVEKALARKILANQQDIEQYNNRQSESYNFYNDNDNDYDSKYNNRYRKRPRRPILQQSRPKRMTAREEQKEKDRMIRSEMKKSVPSFSYLLRQLQYKNLLPAIFFIFSRAGCDDSADMVCNQMLSKSTFQQKIPLDKNNQNINYKVNNDNNEKIQSSRGSGKARARGRGKGKGRKHKNILQDKEGRNFRTNSNYVTDDKYASVFDVPTTKDFLDYVPDDTSLYSTTALELLSMVSLLSFDQLKEVATRIRNFNNENEEIAFPDTISIRFLLGVGSHHAGILPAHKAFVETLFREQLLKVVFATETLAAGINMPARTTVICSIAKRGGSGTINLLETSNLLQMAGRAGRRGMDTEGACVIVASAFEGPTEASDIILSEIEPIKSQFTPSYTLAVNLIARGQGKLDIAKQLVQKSFAMWERNEKQIQIQKAKELHWEENDNENNESDNDNDNDLTSEIWQDRFLTLLQEYMVLELESMQESKKVTGRNKDILKSLEYSLETLSNSKMLKKESKAYVGAMRIVELEQNTLKYLKREADEMIQNLEALEIDLNTMDVNDLLSEINKQQRRVKNSKKELNQNVMNDIANFANQILSKNSSEIESLRYALSKARHSLDSDDGEKMTSENDPVTCKELTVYAKSATVMNRKRKKVGQGDLNYATPLADQLEESMNLNLDDSFDDMRSLINVLESYGCLKSNVNIDPDLEDEKEGEKRYEITSAGANVALLGLDNSLWGLASMGGAWDVAYDSSGLDELRNALDDIYSTDDLLIDDEIDLFDDVPNIEMKSQSKEIMESKKDKALIPKPQEEAETLINDLLCLSAAELAGYVSCLVADEPRRGAPTNVESFYKLSRSQQRVVQNAYLAAERLMEVQKKYAVDASMSTCRLELGTCDVVTAWTAGCTWNEALEMSGASPGDLARVLHRALDALRQFGNLPYHPVRATDGDGVTIRSVSSGIHPDIRQLCKDAADAMDRYPVKDPLPLNEDDVDELIEENVDEAIVSNTYKNEKNINSNDS